MGDHVLSATKNLARKQNLFHSNQRISKVAAFSMLSAKKDFALKTTKSGQISRKTEMTMFPRTKKKKLHCVWVWMIPNADTYFPAVTNISSRHLKKTTLVALPTLRPAAGLPQMASPLAVLHTTTLPRQGGPGRRVGGRNHGKKSLQNNNHFSGSKKNNTIVVYL